MPNRTTLNSYTIPDPLPKALSGLSLTRFISMATPGNASLIKLMAESAIEWAIFTNEVNQ